MSSRKYALFLAALLALAGCGGTDDGMPVHASFSLPSTAADEGDPGASATEKAILADVKNRDDGYWDLIDGASGSSRKKPSSDTAETADEPQSRRGEAESDESAPQSRPRPESDENATPADTVADTDTETDTDADTYIDTDTDTATATNEPRTTNHEPRTTTEGRPPRGTAHPVKPGRKAAGTGGNVGRPPIPGRRVTPPPRSAAAAPAPSASEKRSCLENEKIVKMNSGGFACCPPDGAVCYPMIGAAAPKCQRGEVLTQMRSGEMACCPPNGSVCYPAQ
jgi:hypothetical protein